MRVLIKLSPVVLLLIAILSIQFFILDPQRVEVWYSHGVYTFISAFFRTLFGWLPVSVGDLLYLLIVVYFLRTIFAFFFKQKWRSESYSFKSAFYKLLVMVGFVWIIFHLFWGINYYRLDIGKQFGLKLEKPSPNEVKELAFYLLNETNRYAVAHKQSRFSLSKAQVDAKEAYTLTSLKYPFLEYRHMSLKKSIFGYLGNYMGYSGYYNPISGEAQVNTSMPSFTLPFTTMHEVAHQLGYAKESEANFIGYVSSTFSEDSSIQYSANLEMFLYANASLFRSDSTQAKRNLSALSPVAKKDLKEYGAFIKKYEGPIDKMTSWFYNHFLQANNQPEGLRSYSRVIVWLSAYHKAKKMGNK